MNGPMNGSIVLDETQPNPFAFRRSHSQRGTFKACGKKWEHQYVGRWTAAKRKASYEFGSVVHNVVQLMLGGFYPLDQAVEAFRLQWAPAKDNPTLAYNSRQSWEMFDARGQALIEVCARELPTRIGRATHMEESLRYLLGPETEELCILDLLCDIQTDGGLWLPGCIDFKTSDRKYEPMKAELSPQLMTQQLGMQWHHRPIAALGLVVLIYGPVPQVQWLIRPAFSNEELHDFAQLAIVTDAQIKAGMFFKDTTACFTMGLCPFIPLCYPSQTARIATELVRNVTQDPDEFVWEE